MYNEAGNKYRNAQALFNLGLMHQFGAGITKDLHLAKRCYDRCAACWEGGEWGRGKGGVPREGTCKAPFPIK